MAAFSALRDGLKTRLATISGLRAHDTMPEQLNPPAAVVGGPERIEFDSTFARGADRYLIPIRLFASRADARAGQDLLDGYLAASGPTSVKAAIEGDGTLGGVAHTTRVTEARNYGKYTVADVEFLGVEFLVEIIAAG